MARRLPADRVSVVAAAVAVALILLAVLAPQVIDLVGVPGPGVRSHGTVSALGVPTGPSAAHPFGVDGLGRDVLARVLYGLRSSLEIGAIGTAIAGLIGAAVGLLAGLSPGWLGAVVMWAVEALLALPALLLGLAIAADGAIKPGARAVGLVIVLASFPRMARLVHRQVRALREQEFVQAARAIGASRLRELAPNLIGPVLRYAMLLMAVNVLLEAGLSFLGVGLRAPDVSLGAIIERAGNGIESGRRDWWDVVFPGIVLSASVLAFAVLGRGAFRASARVSRAPTFTFARYAAQLVASAAVRLVLATGIVFVIFGEDVELGTSRLTGRSVLRTIVDRLPASVSVMAGAVLVGVVVAVAVSLVSAVIRSRAAKRAAGAFAWALMSAPTFWLGLVGVYLFSTNIGRVSLFDGPGTYTGLTASPSRWVGSLLLPWLALAAGLTAWLSRTVQSNLATAMAEDYVVTARSKGLSELGVVRHGLRAAVPATLPAVAGCVSMLVSGVILIEVVFRIPGAGHLASEATYRGDRPVVEGVLLFGALFVVVAKLVLEFAYALADPRIRRS